MATQTQKRTETKTIEKPAENGNAKLLDGMIERIDAAARRYRDEIDGPLVGDFRRAVVTARAIQEIKNEMGPDIIRLLRFLMNTPLGFLTDHGAHAFRDDYKQEYGDEVIKTAALEAIIHGVLWTGNHFNILAGRCYLTKEGYAYKLARLAGLSDLNIVPSAPAIRDGHTIVRVAASWKMEGVAASLVDQEGKPSRNFVITVNKSMGPDAVIGKAIRKAQKAIWEKIHGSANTPPDGDVGENFEAAKRDAVQMPRAVDEKPAEPQPEIDPETNMPYPPTSGKLFTEQGAAEAS